MARLLRAVLLAAAVSGCLHAASLKPFRPVVPLAFEENRGQSPASFRHLLTYHNIGFNCSEITWPHPGSMGHDAVFSIRLAGFSNDCESQVSEPAGIRPHYYRGSDRTGWIESVPAFRRLRYVSSLNTVEYRVQSGTLAASITFQNAQALRAFRLNFAAPVSLSENRRIITPTGAWAVSSPQGAVAISLDPNTGSTSFEIAGVPAGSPLTLLLGIPVAPASLAGSPGIYDPQGNWYATGSSRAFSQVDPAAATCNSSSAYFRCADAFVAKFDSELQLVYLVYLSGRSLDAGWRLAADPGGNIYVAGTTFSVDFPTTAGVVQQRYGGPFVDTISRLAQGGDVFIAKLHGETGGLIYSTYLGLAAQESPGDLGVDAMGHPHLLVYSQSTDFPSWGEPLTRLRGCSQAGPLGPTTCTYALALDERGATVRYSKLAPGARRIRVSPAGNVFLLLSAGESGGQTVASMASDGSIRFTLSVPSNLSLSDVALGADGSLWLSGIRRNEDSSWLGYVLARVDANGTELQVTDSQTPTGSSGHTDSAGNLWLTIPGFTYIPTSKRLEPTPDAPLPEPCGGCEGLVKLSPAGAILFATYLPLFNAEVAVGPDDRVLISGIGLQGVATVRYRLEQEEIPSPLISEVVSTDAAAQFKAGNVVTILGAFIGPPAPVTMPLDGNGRVASEVGGLRVLIDGRPSPILMAERHRVTVMVPHATPDSGDSTLTIEQAGARVASLPIQLGGRGYAILGGPYAPPGTGVRNQDGSANTAENPAPAGTFVRFYVAAAGPYDQPLVDGELRHPSLAKPLQTGAVVLGLGNPVEMLSFQQAPDQVAGIMEVVIRTPRELFGQDPVVALPIIFVFNQIPQLSTAIHSVYIAR